MYYKSHFNIIENSFKPKLVKYCKIFFTIILFIELSCEKIEDTDFDSTPNNIDTWDIPKTKIIDGGAGKDGIPSINNPKFVPIKDIDYVQNTDLVLIINMKETTRVYPHKILDFHEAINDIILNHNIAITYCPLTGTGIGFKGLIKGTETTFGISGLVYKNNQILFDRLTESNWSQINRKCVNGTLRGRSANTVTLLETTWETVKYLVPDALVLSDDTGFDRIYGQFPYLDYRTNHEFILFPVGIEDDRLKGKERVYGIFGNPDIKTYPIRIFDDEISIIEDFFNSQRLLLIGSQKHQFITAFIRESEVEYTSLTDQFPLVFADNNGNKYDIFGNVLEGPEKGKRLEQPEAMMGYWFAFVDFFGRPQIYM